MRSFPSAPKHIWKGDEGSLVLMQLGPHLVYCVGTGRIGDEAAALWEAHFPDMVRAGKVTVFFDGFEVQASNSRMTQTSRKSTVAHKAQLDTLHAVVGNPLMTMLARAIALPMGGMFEVHKTREAFENALDTVMQAQGLSKL